MSKKLTINSKATDMININHDVSLVEWLFIRKCLGSMGFGNMFNYMNKQLTDIGIYVASDDISNEIRQGLNNSNIIEKEINEFISKKFKQENKEHQELMEQIKKHEESLAELKAKAERMGK